MRKLRVGLAALAVVLAGTACGDPGDRGGGPAVGGVHALAAAADKASEAGSSSIAMTLTMPVEGQEMTAEAEGLFDFERQIGEMTMKIDAAGLPRGFEDFEIEMIVDGNDGYMRMPPKAGLGDGWYHMDLATPDVDATGMGQLTQDPTQFLEFLRGASDEVEATGTEEIRGVSTTHYEADVSFEKALEQAPNQEAVAALEEEIGTSFEDLGSVPMEAWIDDDGLPRRIALSMPGLEISMDLFDYGIEVDTEAPKKFEEFPGGPGT